MPPAKKPTTPAEARMILALANAERATQCQAAIQAALTLYSCIMVPETIITGDQITSSIRVLARPEADRPAGDPANNGLGTP